MARRHSNSITTMVEYKKGLKKKRCIIVINKENSRLKDKQTVSL